MFGFKFQRLVSSFDSPRDKVSILHCLYTLVGTEADQWLGSQAFDPIADDLEEVPQGLCFGTERCSPPTVLIVLPVVYHQQIGILELVTIVWTSRKATPILVSELSSLYLDAGIRGCSRYGISNTLYPGPSFLEFFSTSCVSSSWLAGSFLQIASWPWSRPTSAVEMWCFQQDLFGQLVICVTFPAGLFLAKIFHLRHLLGFSPQLMFFMCFFRGCLFSVVLW